MSQKIELTLPILQALRKLPEGPWEMQNSCSFRRIGGPDGRDGGVLCAINHSDGHPDLSMNEGQVEALCTLVNEIRAALGQRQYSQDAV